MVVVEPQDGRRQAAKAAEQFISVLSDTATTMCKYYSYYYLTEIQDEDQFAFDHMKLSNKLHHSLYNYATHMAANELVNIHSKFYIEEIPLAAISGAPSNANFPNLSRTEKQQMRRDYNSMLEADIEGDILSYALSITLQDPIDYTAFDFGIDPDVDDVMEEARLIEKRHNVYSQSKKALKAFSSIFSIPRIDPPSSAPAAVEQGWLPAYGGQAWAGVCDSALEYHSLPKDAFIDLMFSVEHNGGNFLNDLPTSVQPDYEQLMQATKNASNRNVQNFNRTLNDTSHKPISDYYKTIIPWILDDVREGVMEIPLTVAAHHDRDVASYLRKNA